MPAYISIIFIFVFNQEELKSITSEETQAIRIFEISNKMNDGNGQQDPWNKYLSIGKVKFNLLVFFTSLGFVLKIPSLVYYRFPFSFRFLYSKTDTESDIEVSKDMLILSGEFLK